MDRLGLAWLSLSDLSVNNSVVCILMQCVALVGIQTLVFQWLDTYILKIFYTGLFSCGRNIKSVFYSDLHDCRECRLWE